MPENQQPDSYYKELSLASLAQGEDAAKVEAALQEIYKNIDDPNTDPKATRKLTYEIVFRPGENREDVPITTSVKITTAPVRKSQQPMTLVRRGGKLHGYTFNPRQGDLLAELARQEAEANAGDPAVRAIDSTQKRAGGQST